MASPGKAVGVVSKKAYAEHRGCSQAYVSKLIRLGKLAEPALLSDGRINVALADQMLGSPAAAEAQSLLPPDTPAEGARYAESRARREAAQADLAELELQRRRGELLPRDAVSAAGHLVFERAVVGIIEAIPDWSIECAALTDPAAIADRLTAHLKRRLAALHQEFMEDAARRAAA